MKVLLRSVVALLATITLAATAMAAETITVYFWDDPSIKPIVEAFNAAQTKVTVDMKILPSADYETKLTTLLAAGSEMDAYFQKRQADMFAQNENGFIEPLDAYFAKTKLDRKAVDAYKDAVIVDGKILAVPFRGASYYTYYNKKVFANAGVPTPDTFVKKGEWNWAKYQEIAKKLATGDGKVYGALQYTWGPQMMIPALQKGNSLISRDGKLTLDPVVYQGLKLRKELESSKAMMGLLDLKITKTHYSKAFFDGNLGMLIIGEWFPGMLQKADTDKTMVGFTSADWAITRLPYDGKDYATFGNPTFTHVAARSKHKDAAFAFVQWLGSAAGAKAVANAGLLPATITPEVKTILGKTILDPGSLNYFTETKRVMPQLMNKYGSQVEAVINKVADDYLSGQLADADLPKRFTDALTTVVNDLK